MRVCVLSYPDVLPAGLLALRAAARRDADVELVEVEPHALQLVLHGRPRVHVGGGELTADVVLHRTVYPYRHLVVPALEVLAGRGSVVLNEPHAALLSRDKVRTLLALSRAGLPTVPTVAVAAQPSAGELDVLGSDEVVVKPALGAQGRGVVRTPLRGLAEVSTWVHDPALGATLVQPLLDAHDLRAYVIGTRCWVAQRWPGPGEWRSNLALGGTATPVHDGGLRREAETTAVAAVAALGLDHAAVDLLATRSGLLLSEVDAWGGSAGVAAALGADLATELLALGRQRWRAAHG